MDGSPLPFGLFATNPPLIRLAVNVALAFTTRLRTSELTFVVAVSASSRRVAAKCLGPFPEIVEQSFGERGRGSELDHVADAAFVGFRRRASAGRAQRTGRGRVDREVLGTGDPAADRGGVGVEQKARFQFQGSRLRGENSALLCHNLERVLAVRDDEHVVPRRTNL